MSRRSLALLSVLLAGRAHADELLTLYPGYGTSRQLGAAVAVDGDLAVVGAPLDGTFLKQAGGVYVFDLRTGTVAQKLFASDAKEFAGFGWSVDVDGGLAVVGAVEVKKKGSAYVLDLATGQELFHWEPLPGGNLFGWDVAIDAQTAAVLDLKRRLAYVYDLTTGQRRLLLRLPGWYPYSIALDGRHLLVGDDVWRRAYLFDAVSGELLQSYAPPIVGSMGFGMAVALDGDVVLVGAPVDQGANPGRAYAFDRASGKQLALLQPADGRLGDQYGASVDVRGGLAVVGAPHDPIFSGSSGKGLGAVHVYDATSWEELLVERPGQVTPQDLFGAAVATDGGRLVAGAPKAAAPQGGRGLAYLFCASDDPVGATYCSPANPNSFGLSATIEARGCQAVVSDHLRLHATSLPPVRPTTFLASRTPGFVPNVGGSDGDLCLGGAIGRFARQTAVSDAIGSIAITLDLDGLPPPLPPAVSPGETWYFQAWYRDGAGSNLTDAVRVTFR